MGLGSFFGGIVSLLLCVWRLLCAQFGVILLAGGEGDVGVAVIGSIETAAQTRLCGKYLLVGYASFFLFIFFFKYSLCTRVHP